MVASGTSFSAPVVSGAVALILQKNPGLTPPMVKAILQYTAEALPNQNLMQQGAGLVNVVGALTLSDALATNISSRIAAGAITAGDSILAGGKSMPAPTSIIDGRVVPWSRIVYLGGDRIYSGEALFTKYQGIYQPKLTWVRGSVRTNAVLYYDTAKTLHHGLRRTHSVRAQARHRGRDQREQRARRVELPLPARASSRPRRA